MQHDQGPCIKFLIIPGAKCPVLAMCPHAIYACKRGEVPSHVAFISVKPKLMKVPWS